MPTVWYFCHSFYWTICLFWKTICFVDIVKRIDRVSLLLHHNLSMFCLKFLGFLFYMNIFYFRYVGDCLFNVIENLNIFVVGIFYYHLIMGVEVNKIQKPSLRNSAKEDVYRAFPQLTSILINKFILQK